MRHTINIIRYMLVAFALLLSLWSCDVHEFPAPRPTIAVNVNLEFATAMRVNELNDPDYKWENGIISEGTDIVNERGTIRYNVRVYSGFATRRSAAHLYKTMEFTRDLSEGYATDIPLELPEGDWTVMVWTDFVPDWQDAVPFYNSDDFVAIMLTGNHKGNTDYRDAFRGVLEMSLESSTNVVPVEEYKMLMERPLAKYEFIATDFEKFLRKEVMKKVNSAHGMNVSELMTRVGIDNYKAVFYYSGFMPCEYNMFIDKPVDSKKGVFFESQIKNIADREASLGFDYVMVNGSSASVSVQIAVFDENGEEVSRTNAMSVPLKRNHHTVMRGGFLMQQASGGIVVQPDFDGDHNVVIP